MTVRIQTNNNTLCSVDDLRAATGWELPGLPPEDEVLIYQKSRSARRLIVNSPNTYVVIRERSDGSGEPMTVEAYTELRSWAVTTSAPV